MPAQPTSLTFKQTIETTPAEAFRMFTHATALRDWFSDVAEADARADGQIFLNWNSGHYVCATIKKFEPGQKLVLTWDGKGEPEPTKVTITFKAKETQTLVTVSHSGLGTGAKWAATRHGVEEGWPDGLENLKSVMETGIDLRFARRPRLGIIYDEFNAEIAKTLGTPVTQGMLIQGTAEGTGARALGWEKGDVLVKMSGKTITGTPSLGVALQGRHAGDKVPVTWYRGAEKMTGTLQLGTFPIAQYPQTPDALAAAMRQMYAEVNAAMAKMLEGIMEEQAAARPGVEWSINELVGHFVLCERDYQSWVADMLNDRVLRDDLEMRPNVAPRVQAIVERYKTLEALLTELHISQAETVVVIEKLPPVLVGRRHVYRRLAQWAVEFVASHFHEEHAAQFEAAVAAARSA